MRSLMAALRSTASHAIGLEVEGGREQRPRVVAARRGEDLLRRPSSTTLPFCITTISVASARTTFRSWLMKR